MRKQRMREIALGLITGTGAVLLLPPSPWLLVALAPVCVLVILCTPHRLAGLAVLLGAALAAAALQSALGQRLDPALAGADLRVTGTVAGLPERDDRRLRFRFLPRQGTLDGRPVELPARLRLSWYGRNVPSLAPGERWQLSVRLRVPRGFANPGGFDYPAWLLRHRIGATGYVRSEPAPRRLAGATASIDGLRAGLRDELAPALAERTHAGVLLALTLGDRSRIGPAAWETLVTTGTNHLMAISGLHIGLVALLGYGLGAVAWRVGGGAGTRVPRPVFQSAIALALATGYAALAGFALPTVRALVMLFIALGALCLRRRVRADSVLAGAAVVVLASDPLAVLDPGFWLSFGAVAAIVVVAAGRVARPRRLDGWMRLQLAISLALTPLLLGLFRQASVVAPVANLLAVPWVSALTVPSALGGAALMPFWPGAGSVLLTLSDLTLQALWWLLAWLAALPLSHWRAPAYPVSLLAVAAIGAAILLLPRGVPGRATGLVALLPLLLWQAPRPAAGEVWLDVLDVGQGLAAVVRTRDHTLVYDTGPRFSARFDSGRAVVNPFLEAIGTGRLDGLVVSHGDNDHAGGAESVRARFPPRQAWTSTPHRTSAPDRFCGRGNAWTWDGVAFEFLHPDHDSGWQGNDGSCVLRIDAPGGSILLPGDIESPAERHLVESGTRLTADVVVAPHHGSASSSTPAFVRAVDPEWVLYPVGHDNQWDFPHAAVMDRWRPAGWARTDCGGALHLRIHPRDGVIPPRAWRIVNPRRWAAGCADSGKSGNMRAFERPAAGAARAPSPAASAGPEGPLQHRHNEIPGRHRV
jgi:competence protein ComEC